MTDLVVHPAAGPLRGIVPVASDKSIVHRAIMFGALADGTSTVTKAWIGDDHRSTIDVFRALGVEIDVDEKAKTVSLRGRGLDGLSAPTRELDCGNSGTTMRLMAGILAAQRFASTLVGDASLNRRPMARIATPLRQRGARIEGRPSEKKVGEITAPLVIGPLPAPHVLSETTYASPVASAQVKSALLLSGLYSDGKTTVSEPMVSRDHTERMLSALGVPIRRLGPIVELDAPAWGGALPAFELEAPGDPSAAAFAIAAALIVPKSEVRTRGVGVNPTRMGLYDVLRWMGAALEVEHRGEALGEPIGEITALGCATRGARASGEVIARAIDEIPILSVVAARSAGTTTIHDAEELRVKESDRIAAIVRMLRAFGASVEEMPDGVVIEGREGGFRAARVESGGDHRIAMSAAILALLGDGPSRIVDVDCISTSFPRFVATLRALGATIDVER
ncbi:MAG: 3-phosphoshikimate 1-carboxyvinyltransferase [Polyangiaceae bacterium]